MKGFLKWQPGPKDVAKRYLALAIVFQRGSLEDVDAMGNGEEREQERIEILAWARQVGLFDSLSSVEKRRLQTPVGKLSRQDRVDSGWRLESMGTLEWAMEIRQMLPYDIQFPLVDHPFVPFMSKTSAVRAFVGVMKLRTQEEIDRERDIAQLWHWRSRTIELQRSGATPPRELGMDFVEITAKSAKFAYEAGLIPEPKGGDFPAFSKPYRDLAQSEYEFVTSVSVERHWALNWLCGYSRDWDKVPTDT